MQLSEQNPELTCDVGQSPLTQGVKLTAFDSLDCRLASIFKQFPQNAAK